MLPKKSLGKIPRSTEESAFSFVEVLLGLGLMLLLALALSKELVRGVSESKGLMDREEIAMLRRNIEVNLSCTQTLSIEPTTTLPLTCSNYTNVILKNGRGQNLKTGLWQVQGRCQNNELVVAVLRVGLDPLTGKAWSTMPMGTDLFNGLGKFCSEYFSNVQCAAADYPLFMGLESSGPKCCRMVKTTAMTLATAQCNPTEYAAVGGHNCQPAATGFVWPAGTPADVQGFVMARRSFLGPDGKSWSAECISNDSAIPIGAKAIAYCCPL